ARFLGEETPAPQRRRRPARRRRAGGRGADPDRVGRGRVRRPGPAALVPGELPCPQGAPALNLPSDTSRRVGPASRAGPAYPGPARLAGPTPVRPGGGPMQQELLSRLGKALVEGSLSDEARLAELDRQPTVQILPEANVIKVGGQSFIDRGRAAVFPLI